MEPDRQLEIQLGHMCNNRCVFCVSGQRTAMREAFPLEREPLLEHLERARAQGIQKITLLGGEPTLQPAFMDVVRHAVALGFEEIVLFTNGAKTARAEFVDEVLATGGRFTWRLSFQGGNALAHDRTTGKLGSFTRLRRTMEHLRERGQPITVNLCVVQSNFASVGDFPALLIPFGVRQLHLDMVRPLDAGQRTDDELRGMMPRYAELAAPMRKLVDTMPEGFDLNLGNLPYCVAPELAPWIHHDGEHTLTVAIDDHDQLSEAWDKYQVKRRDKVKRASCARCVFDGQCNGVFETYERFYGLDEFEPVTPERLLSVDRTLRLLTVHMRAGVAALARSTLPARWTLARHDEHDREARVRLDFVGQNAEGARVSATVLVQRPGEGVAGTERFSLALAPVEGARPDAASLRALLEHVLEVLGEGHARRHPVGDDLAALAPFACRAERASSDPRVSAALRRLHGAAPFGALRWSSTRAAPEAQGFALTLEGEAGKVELTVGLRANAPWIQYALVGEPADREACAAAVRQALAAVRPSKPAELSPERGQAVG